MKRTVTAAEYDAAGRFKPVSYAFEEDSAGGWVISRDGADPIHLGEGYTPVDVRFCGVCATDLARANLPHPLPQVTGHEVIGRDDAGRRVVVEINASHHARGLAADCAFCQAGLPTHCPERITLGINQLPGGFSPLLLAPSAGLYPVPPNVPDAVASLTEPLAAALHAVRTTPPSSGERVAVLGPRRLGGLIVAALAAERRRLNRDYEIVAVVRHDRLGELALALGADRAINLNHVLATKLKDAFETVFDTTGSPDGLMLAMEMARLNVHLKSTHGNSVAGLRHITGLVVDELSLLPPLFPVIADQPLPRNVAILGVGRSTAVLPPGLTGPGVGIHRLDRNEAVTFWQGRSEPNTLERFDIAFATDLASIDFAIRPFDQTPSIVRPRGAIVVAEHTAGQSSLCAAMIERGISIHTSRCGDYPAALELLAENPALVRVLEARFITHRKPLTEIESAFKLAANSNQAVKVLIHP